MPLDARIPLGIQPPQGINPLAAYGEAQQVANAVQRGQIQRQEMEANTLQIAEAKRASQAKAREEQKNLDEEAAYHEAAASATDADDLLKRIQPKVRAKTYLELQKGVLEARKERAAISKDELEVSQDKNSRLASLTGAAIALPDAEYAAQWPQLAAMAKEIDPSLEIPDQPIDKRSLSFLRSKFLTHEMMDKEATAKRQQSETDAKLPGLTAESEMKRRESGFQANDPNLLKPNERTTADIAQKKFDQDLKEFSEKVRSNKVTEAETRRYHDMSLDGVTLTDDAKQKMAEMFATTGALPNLGLGKAAGASKSEIINLAAKQFPNVDFASNKAAFQANQSSLRRLQATSDSTDAFENTAGKNIDIFLNAAKDIVDTGSPLLNKPVRAISGTLFGSAKKAAFDTARETALTEAAKVLESPQGGGALTVSGREAVKTLSSPDATLGQQVAAMKVLRGDMANRKRSNAEQIKAINDRIASSRGDSSAAPKGDPLGVR